MECATSRTPTCQTCGHERFYHVGGTGCCLHVHPRGATQRRCLCAGYAGAAPVKTTPGVELANRVNRLRAWVDAGVDMTVVRRELADIASMVVKLK